MRGHEQGGGRGFRIGLFLLVWFSCAWFGSWEGNPNNATRLFAAVSLVEDGELMRDRMAFGGLIAATDYVQALRRRRELCAAMTAAAQDVDLLVTAGAPVEAPPIDGIPKWDNLARPGFTAPFNLTGWPALAVCSGFGAGGLPVSVQIAAKPFQDATLLRAGHAFEQATDFRARRPTGVPAPARLMAAAP